MLASSDESVVDGEKTNVWVFENIKLEMTLGSRVAQAALRYFGHVVREERGMENDVMLGETSKKRRRGRPSTIWLDNVNNIKGPSINIMKWEAIERYNWRRKGYRGWGRTRLDGTR